MKKSLNQTLDEDVSERSALTRKLYRYISDATKRVDEGTSKSKSISDIFAPSLEVYRQKLRENCEKLIFADPLLYGRKAQELLWRKGYYEAVATSKKFRESCKDQEQLVVSHIDVGVGHYHSLISKIQHEIGMNISLSHDYPQSDVAVSKHHNKEDLKEFTKTFVQNCLIYLGDLCRYKTDYSEPWAFSMSYRYYMQAASMDPNVGMPYNQLGTLHTGRNHHLDSASYYIVCLLCEVPFDGAEGNLARIFDKNTKHLENAILNPDIIDQQESIKIMVCKFLSLVEHWFFEKPLDNFNEVCTSTLYDVKECLKFQPLMTGGEADASGDHSKYLQQNELTPDYVSPNLINRMVFILLLLINKLQKENSSLVMPLKTFTLSVLSQLLHKLHVDFVTIGFDKDVVSKIIEGFREKIRNHKNSVRSTSNKMENGYHKPEPNGDANEKIDTEKTSPDVEEIVSVADVDGEEYASTQKEDTKSDDKLSNGHASVRELKQSKAKNKKASLLQKLRRRKRNTSSGSSESSDNDSDVEEESCNGSDQLSTDDSDVDDEDGDSYSTTSSEEDHEGNNGSIDANDLEGNANADAEVTKPESEDTEVLQNITDTNTLDNTEETTAVFNQQLFVEFLENNNVLVALHLILNWLFGEGELISSCGANGRSMFLALVNVLNTIHGQMFPKLSWNNYSVANQFHPFLKTFHELFFSLKYNGFRKIPLVEDYDVKKLEICDKGLKYIDWEKHERSTLSKVEASTIRLMKIVDFGAFIVKLNVGIVFNKRLKLYLLKKTPSKKPNYKKYGKSSRDIHIKTQRPYKGRSADSSDKGNPKLAGGSLMKNLGRLWLSEQVRALESEVGSKKQPNLPAYVILDADALTQQTHLVKQLVATKRLIVLVPTIVLHTMDELKKDSGAARSAIRWLENQLSNGSRFIRTQRPNENTPLPHVKYPKKIHRHVHNFIQIVEFCHFFLSNDPGENPFCRTNMNGSGDCNSKDESKVGDTYKNGEVKATGNHLVVLLTGSSSLYTEQKDFSYKGVAHSAGITMESIQDFCFKWRHFLGKGTKKR